MITQSDPFGIRRFIPLITNSLPSKVFFTSFNSTAGSEPSSSLRTASVACAMLSPLALLEVRRALKRVASDAVSGFAFVSLVLSAIISPTDL